MSVSRTGSTPTPFGFVGAQQYQADVDSGLRLRGHRYYYASIGRFISSDIANAGMNWNYYCRNNPTGKIDPLGPYVAVLSTVPLVSGEGVVVGIGVIITHPGETIGAIEDGGRWTGDRIGDIGRGIGDWIGGRFAPSPLPEDVLEKPRHKPKP